MRLHIIKRHEYWHRVWICEDDSGLRHFVDLVDDVDVRPGAVIEVERLVPYIEFGYGVRLVSPGERTKKEEDTKSELKKLDQDLEWLEQLLSGF